MAVLHLDVLAWRGKDLRCVGSSVLVGVFFIWAFFFVALRPSHPTTTTSQQSAESSGLSQQKTIREQTDIAENITISTNASDDSALGTGRDDEDDAPHRRKGNDKDSEKTPSKAARKANRQDSPKHSRRDPTAGSQQGTPRTRNEEEAGETDEDTSHPGTSKEPRQKKGGMTDSGGREARPKPRLAADPTAHHTLPQTPLTPAPDLLASSRFDTPVTDLEHMPVKPFSSPFVESEDEDSLAKAEKKIITWYRPTNTRDVNRAKKILKECPEPRCKLVYPLPPVLRADAMIFTEVDGDSPPPVRTHSEQVYVLRAMNPPTSLPQRNGAWPSAWNPAFNWTWSYRRDADLWQPFGRLRTAEPQHVPSEGFFSSLAKAKTRPVAWVVPRDPGCSQSSSSERADFVRELEKHIAVTEFGSCSKSNRSCSEGGVSCSENLSKNFFFLLALEDAACKDYVTGVFYRAWQEGTHVIPVVRGGADYATFFPEGTFVDADWFGDSAEKLADFLFELMKERELYAHLLWRKAHWKAARRGGAEESALCSLCYRLQHLQSFRKTYPDIRGWFQVSGCQLPNL